MTVKVLFGLVCASLISASASGLPARAAEVTDAAGRRVNVEDASRIVSIGGAVTEILYALGLEDRIVGVDSTSTYPGAAGDKPDVGYMRALSAEGVLSLEPSVIVAVEGSGPPQVIEVLSRASVPFVLIPDETSPEGVVEKIRAVAVAVGAEARGEELAQAVAADLAAVEQAGEAIGQRRRAVFVLGMQGGQPLVAGEGTSAASIIALAGAENALAGFSGFKPASAEAMLAAAPDAIVTMGDRHDPAEILASPAFRDTPAVRDGRIVSMSGLYLLGFGPRTAQAARELSATLYPDIAPPDLPRRDWAGEEEPAP